MKAHQIALAVCLVGSLVFQIDPLSVAGAEATGGDVQDKGKGIGHRKLVEIPVQPNGIAWLKIDNSESQDLASEAIKLRDLLKRSEPYTRSLPFENQHSRDEMEQLRKDPAKYQSTYHGELQQVLKEQFYFWDELNQIAEALKEMRERLHSKEDSEFYTIRIGFKEGVNGIEQVNYAVTGYLEARAIAEDFRKGVIKSLTVYTETFSGLPFDPQARGVPCAPACWISAFGF